ncbi:adenylate/guanylate cyclase domain-containing protein [Alteromonas gilva]|uniref:Adenylate/guanylate cyclase domain-containing protein n=1 Tax=Alteromonas gilva TaxID=2987522 RepID=A0ABT5L1B4_9ALTE|nr:adenylate/guanylate cyclase domain-containing protein [Alteromonas gilva]MDC8830836.1 adenylate/guanylate cyclase domain-containing protein [Alteromonas gilva]
MFFSFFQPAVPGHTGEHVRLTLHLTLTLFTVALLLQLPALWLFATPWSARYCNWLAHFGMLFLLIAWQQRLSLRSLKLVLFTLYYSYLCWTGWLWPDLSNIHYFYLLAVVITGFVFTRQERSAQLIALLGAILLFVLSSASQYQPNQPASILIVTNDITLGGLCLAIYAVLRRQAMDRWQHLRSAHKTSQATLHSLLPHNPDKPRELWASGTTKRYSHMCVLFADLHGYTALNRQLGDAQVVQALNALYSAIDALTTRHAIEKIKTNGDQYMAVCGMQPASVTECCNEMLRFARGLLKVVSQAGNRKQLDCKVRIGIATGPVTAGIIGIEKPFFDVWGETVNIAAYLEQVSPQGVISLCPNTMAYLAEHSVLTRKPLTSAKHPNLTHCFELAQ